MDFIERVFQLSPDGGSGMLELLLLLIPVLLTAASGLILLPRRYL